MDFGSEARKTIDGFECGSYSPISTGALPRLYVAYSTDAGEPTEVFHNRLRERYDSGESAVLAAMERFVSLTEEAVAACQQGDVARLHRLMDENYDTRASICRLPVEHVAMIEAARSTGASAKFAGSGGAIVGCCHDDAMFNRLGEALSPLGCRVITPSIAEPFV